MADHCLVKTVKTCEGGGRRAEFLSSQLTFISLQSCRRGQKYCDNHVVSLYFCFLACIYAGKRPHWKDLSEAIDVFANMSLDSS